MKKIKLLCGTMLMGQVALAADMSGVVLDEQGAPISGAVVEVVGANLQVATDAQGRFELRGLPDRSLELHVKAPNFMHRTLHLDSPQQQAVELRLSRSVMEVINVVGLPWHASNMESAQPVSVLSGDRLRNRQAASLGDTLKYEVGVHSNYYGPVASSPIIRGLEGPRVLVTQNGLDAGDASRVGPDHAVATEATTARQIEILRGPATLFYGSGAIGGVINVVDDRVPQDTQTSGEWRVAYGSAATDRLVSGSITGGVDNAIGSGGIALHADGFWREAEDYRIRDGMLDEDDSRRIENSAFDARGLSLGGSYLLDRGFIGLSYGRLERNYGIPGHSHGHSDEADEAELDVYADLKQDRVQLQSELALSGRWFSAVNTRLGYTDYEHREIENSLVGTVFKNESQEARLELFHHPLWDWRGALSLHYKHSDFEARGMEAFTPPSKTESFALALMEERHVGDVLLQLGARIEQVETKADELIVDLGKYPGQQGHGAMHSMLAVTHKATPFSASIGAVWDFMPGYNLGFSLSHAQRAPSAAELLSFGPHIGTGLFEVGALLALHEEGEDDFHFDLARTKVALEESNNLDLFLRKYSGDRGFVLNAFYNRIDDYYYLQDTGLRGDSGHAHEHDHGDDGHEEDLPIHIYEARDAELYGLEAEFVWQLATPLQLALTTDYVRARLRAGGDLPRTPPLRIGGRLQYQGDSYSLELGYMRYTGQTRVAAHESTTAGYHMLDLQFNFHFDLFGQELTFFLQGHNLTDARARVHSSLLKDIAPLPERAATVGISGRF